METESYAAHSVVKEDYHILAKCDVSIELPKGVQKAVFFYREMAKAMIRWNEEVMGEQAKKEYGELTDFWQKARFLPFRTTLTGRAFPLDEAHFLILCNSAFTHGNEKELRRSAQVWNRERETILPMRQVMGKWYGKHVPTPKGFLTDGCYPENGKFVLFCNPKQGKPFLERRMEIPKNKNEKMKKRLAK